MKNLFLFFLFVLTTCAAIEENFDDHIILEKSKEKPIASLIKPKIRQTTGVTISHITRYTIGVTTSHTTRYTTGVTARHSSKRQTPIPRKTSKYLKNSPIKGINGLFTGKLGEEFRKQKDPVKKIISKNIKNNESKSFPRKVIFYPGSPAETYRGPLNNLPSDIKNQALNFA